VSLIINTFPFYFFIKISPYPLSLSFPANTFIFTFFPHPFYFHVLHFSKQTIID